MTAKQGGSTTLLGLGFFPCPLSATSCGTGNNGNLQSQTITIPGLSQPLTQTYSYDHLNRLAGAQESGGTAPWSQSYGYDTQGNRWVSASSGPAPNLTLSQMTETPQGPGWYSTTVPNRIASWSYDQNGNVLQVGSMARSFTYDAENRQATATVGSATFSYAYDGSGQRVSKTVNGQTTTYVYDAFGHLAAEYGSSTASPCSTPTCYITVDHLGSTRLLTDSSGNPVKRYDYLPFGEEIFAGVDNRTTAMGFDPSPSPDSSDPKYTGQYRDAETVSNVGNELDWFNVRYYSGAGGRFQSPDPANAGAVASNPQTWNMYSYVNNNPLSYTDPTGLFIVVPSPSPDPVSLGIDIAIGIFDLYSLFSGGGGPPPSIPSALATPSSPVLQPSPDFDSQGWNDPVSDGTDPSGLYDPGSLWNEHVPIGRGGVLGMGGVFGGGSTGPFIFSAQAASQADDVLIDSPYFPALVRGVHSASPVANPKFIAGWYGASAVFSTTVYAAYDISLIENGAIFGTRVGGNQPLLNGGNTLRIGWSYIRSTGQYVFRIGGTAVAAIKENPHLNLWPPSWWFK